MNGLGSQEPSIDPATLTNSFSQSDLIQEELISATTEEENDRDVETLEGSIDSAGRTKQTNGKNKYETLIGQINEFRSG